VGLFLAYSRLWAVKRLRSDEINKIKTDVHPLAYLRTNVTVMQFDEFQKQFDIRPVVILRACSQKRGHVHIHASA